MQNEPTHDPGTIFLWNVAIDAKIDRCSLPHGFDQERHAQLRNRLHRAEADLMEATGLDLDTVQQVLDFAASIPSSTPERWLVSLDT